MRLFSIILFSILSQFSFAQSEIFGHYYCRNNSTNILLKPNSNCAIFQKSMCCWMPDNIDSGTFEILTDTVIMHLQQNKPARYLFIKSKSHLKNGDSIYTLELISFLNNFSQYFTNLQTSKPFKFTQIKNYYTNGKIKYQCVPNDYDSKYNEYYYYDSLGNKTKTIEWKNSTMPSTSMPFRLFRHSKKKHFHQFIITYLPNGSIKSVQRNRIRKLNGKLKYGKIVEIVN
jgi:hypothetical protein